MRLIDADALIKDFPIRLDHYDKEHGNVHFVYGIETVIEYVEAMPTIDAVEVKRGEWKANPKIGWGETWVCSICGEKTTSSIMGYPRYKYCPMCGAKMERSE